LTKSTIWKGGTGKEKVEENKGKMPLPKWKLLVIGGDGVEGGEGKKNEHLCSKRSGKRTRYRAIKGLTKGGTV